MQFYLNRGMKVTKIHRGIKFDTQRWINSYIEYNTHQRHIFKNDETKKAFFKLMNLTVYGKTIENPAKRSDVRLYTDIEKAMQVAGKLHCIDWRLFSEILIGIQMRKEQVLINKPFK